MKTMAICCKVEVKDNFLETSEFFRIIFNLLFRLKLFKFVKTHLCAVEDCYMPILSHVFKSIIDRCCVYYLVIVSLRF